MTFRIFKHVLPAVAIAILAAAGASAQAAEWGTVKGKFVYEGQVEPEPLTITKDPEFCSEHHPVDETIVLGDAGALQNVFVYLYVARGKKVDVNPDLKPSAEPKVLTNKGCRFEPHAMVLWTSDTLEVRNDDTIGHNTNIAAVVNSDFNQTVTNAVPLKPSFTKSEPVPTGVVCNIHPWMKGYVLIRDNPYMAVSGEDGSFEIKDVPAGKQEFIFWHEAKGYLRDLPVGEEKADRKGQVKVTVPAGGEIDLGEIVVKPAMLGKK